MWGWIAVTTGVVGGFFYGLAKVAGWGSSSAPDDSPDKIDLAAAPANATSLGGSLTCQDAISKLPLDMQNLVGVALSSGSPGNLDWLAKEVDKGVSTNMIDAKVGSRVAQCLRNSKAVIEEGVSVAPKPTSGIDAFVQEVNRKIAMDAPRDRSTDYGKR